MLSVKLSCFLGLYEVAHLYCVQFYMYSSFDVADNLYYWYYCVKMAQFNKFVTCTQRDGNNQIHKRLRLRTGY